VLVASVNASPFFRARRRVRARHAARCARIANAHACAMHAGDADDDDDDGARCPYAILGVEPHEATQQSIRRAYRALSMRFHPDKNPARDREACEEAFKRIAWAYEMIGDEDRRRQWDYGTMSARAPSSAPRAHAGFRDPFEMFASVFGDDFAQFASGGARGTSMFGGAFDAPDPFFSASRAAEPSSFAFGGGFGGSMFGNSMFQSSAFAPSISPGSASMFGGGSFTSTSTSTHVSADGTTVTRSVTRRTLPDGSIEETENVSTTPGGYGYDAIGGPAAPRGGFYY